MMNVVRNDLLRDVFSFCHPDRSSILLPQECRHQREAICLCVQRTKSLRVDRSLPRLRSDIHRSVGPAALHESRRRKPIAKWLLATSLVSLSACPDRLGKSLRVDPSASLGMTKQAASVTNPLLSWQNDRKGVALEVESVQLHCYRPLANGATGD